MILLVIFLIIFAAHYGAFLLYLHKKGLSTDHLIKNIFGSYIISAVVGSLFLFLSTAVMVGGTENYPFINYLYLSAMVAGYSIPITIVLKKKLGTSWLPTFGIATIPLIIVILALLVLD